MMLEKTSMRWQWQWQQERRQQGNDQQ